MTTITVRDLVKRFDNEKTAVNKVSFAIQEGEFLVLVGPSGCGKTTTLRLLAGLETVTSGEIRFGERLVNEVRPRDRNIGMVFQDYAVFPHLTVFDNIAYGLRSRRAPMALIRQRVTDAARTFRIDHLLMRKPRQLSGGERQRVALARAMARDADLYLFDEPLSNLDAQLRHQAREDILNFHRLKRVVPTVYVTHDQSEAMSMGDRIAVMRAGKIEQIGSGSELYNQPVNLFVAYFIGAPSMNLFDVRLVAESDGVYAIGADQADSGVLRLRLSPSYEPVVRMYLGAVVKLGIRPENLHVPKQAPFPVDEDNTLHGTLNEIEPTATGCTAYLSTTSDKDYVATFKIRLPASYIGKEIPLALDMERIHLFDTTTERSLLYGNAVRNTVN